MRIALLTTSWPAHEHDPAGHFVRAEARALQRQGHEVEVITPAPGGAFGWPGAAARLRERPARALDAARWIVSASRRVARTPFERVVAHWALPSGFPIATASRRAALEVVSHGGDVRLLLGVGTGLRQRIVRLLAARSERWRFVSQALLDGLLGALTPATRALLEPIAAVEAPPLDLPDVGAEVAARRRSLGGMRVAVSVGRLVPGKRVERAIAAVACRRDLDALVVVGDGPERHRLQRFARDLGVDARFVGAVARPEALAWIGAAAVLLQASASEGLSTIEREAAALGTPVERL
ncbi:MAG: glycosyltransferase family 4 protein [Myxococcales bacterium]|nr:glycosyltransferase family 4 protein [Myxococcales bacterium]